MLSLRDETRFQPLPKEGFIADHLDSPLPHLENPSVNRSTVFSYIVATTDLDEEARLRQSGSGPNFQGGLITLATCKHRMRASLDVEEWKGAWIAGLSSSRLHEGKQWLFFLTRIEHAYASHAELWQALPAAVREAKSAQEHIHGDVFKPKKTAGRAPHSAASYYPPRDGHRHEKPEKWHEDIESHAWGRPSALLVGDPQKSFLWTEPVLCYRGSLTQGYKKWESLAEFLGQIEEAR